MRYFSQLPYINYQQIDGSTVAMKDIMTRTYLVNQLTKQPLLFYEYELKDSDLPEIVANKYYGAPEQFWLLSLSNQNSVQDLQWDWPLNQQNFNLFLIDKYGSLSNSVLEIHHYEKIMTNEDVATGEQSQFVTIIDQGEYANTTIGTTTYSMPDGSTIKQTISKAEVNAYDYEYNLNESKRNIGLIDKDYVLNIENQFKALYSR
jgi:hypothetical protein